MSRATKYHTKQQKVILDCLVQSGEGYLTAGQIAAYLKKRGETVGLTTIYRQLERFEKDGVVHKILLDGKSGAYYQYAGEEEDQLLLKCEDCGGIIPMECSHMMELYQHVLQSHRFQVNPHRTMFYGTCDNCLEGRKDKEK